MSLPFWQGCALFIIAVQSHLLESKFSYCMGQWVKTLHSESEGCQCLTEPNLKAPTDPQVETVQSPVVAVAEFILSSQLTKNSGCDLSKVFISEGL